MSVEELIAALNDIEETLKDEDLDMNDIIPGDRCPGVSFLAEEVLITNTGQCSWHNIEALRNAGYEVFPIERDSFGWLIAGIQTTCGVVTYG
jgi:hypothetical protein